MKRVAMVHLGRAAAMGGQRRVRSLGEVFAAAGADVVELPLLIEAPSAGRLSTRPDVAAVLRRDAVPETLAWSARAAVESLERIGPDLVICSTARSFHPALAHRWPTVIDFIDRLSDSYRDRSRVAGGVKGLGFRVLGGEMAHFERRQQFADVPRWAAGWSDARALNAEWVPITIEAAGTRPTSPEPPFDAVFFGNLSYEPNVAAVERLTHIWPLVNDALPGSRLLIAGAHPAPSVQRTAAEHGWTLQADFDRVEDVLASAKVAVAPLDHASGIQTKVLEAAAHGRAQVVSAAVFAGLDPRFPVEINDSDVGFARTVVELITSSSRRDDLGRRAAQHMAGRYSVQAWVPWAASVLEAQTLQPA